MTSNPFRTNKRRKKDSQSDIDWNQALESELNVTDEVDEPDLDLEQELMEGPHNLEEEDTLSMEQVTEPLVSDPEQKPKKKSNSSPPNGELHYPPFVGRGTELFIVKKSKNGMYKEEPLGKLVFIKEILENIDDQTFELVLRYWYMNQWRELRVDRSQLQLNELTKLLNHGVDVHNFKAGQIAMFLSLQENDAPMQRVHEKLGWAEGNAIYKHQELLGSHLPYSSTYKGKLLLQSGTFEGWEQVVKREVLGHIPMEFALVCGFASPIVSLISRELDMEVIIFHAYGDTSQGKTTAGRTMVSSFGLPSRKEGGLMIQWNGTPNGIIAQVSKKHGIPLVLDEASMNRMQDFTGLLYQLAEGIEKARQTKELKLREKSTWSGFFFSTAEHSLRQKANQNGGLVVRIFEHGNVPWTQSAENAKNIRDGFLKNYGQAGPMFVKFLLEKEKETIVDVWKKWAKICYEKMELKDSLSDRMADKFALILATADLMNEYFDFAVNTEGIMNFLLEMDQENIEGRDMGERAYQYLKQMVIQYQAHFYRHSSPPSRDCWGKISDMPGKGVEVTFMKEPFKKLIHEGGFDDSSVVLSKLKEKGYLVHEAGKNTRRRMLDPSDKKRLDLYCITFDSSLFDMLEKDSPTFVLGKGAESKPQFHELEDFD